MCSGKIRSDFASRTFLSSGLLVLYRRIFFGAISMCAFSVIIFLHEKVKCFLGFGLLSSFVHAIVWQSLFHYTFNASSFPLLQSFRPLVCILHRICVTNLGLWIETNNHRPRCVHITVHRWWIQLYWIKEAVVHYLFTQELLHHRWSPWQVSQLVLWLSLSIIIR